jgi:sugar/nucleoside kinase (ribokinase family)
MCPDIICLGEMLVEIMRAEVGVPHIVPGLYKGPYPSGAPVGVTSGYIGVVGNDDFGLCITQKLSKDGVDISQVRVDKTKTTGAAFVQYNKDGTRKFIFSAGAAGQTNPDDINKAFFKGIKNLHIMGSALSISENSRDACYKAVKIAKECNPDVVISFDPNLRVEMLPIETIIKICKPIVDAATVILPSGEEAEMLAGIKGEDAACKELLKRGTKMVVLKRAKNGSRVYTGSKVIDQPSFKVNEVDPTGAGDSFGGAFMVGYIKNTPIEENLKFANAVGAMKVTSFGPMPDHSRNDVIEFIKKNQSK